jgi:hypothetical protein
MMMSSLLDPDHALLVQCDELAAARRTHVVRHGAVLRE